MPPKISKDRIYKASRMLWGLVAGREPTWCHLLGDSAFVSDNGAVFACCHALPFPFGNIYRDPLDRIWHRSVSLRTARALSAHRRLFCAYSCNLVSARERARPLAFDREYPDRLWLLVSERCNLRCVMCEQDHRSRTVLDPEVLKRNVDWSRIREVELQGGEFLALRGARELYTWLTAEGRTKANLITNGMLIDDDWAERLVNGALWIVVSVNAATKATHEAVNRGSNFERVMGNIGRLVAAKRRHASPVTIVYKFTVVPENVLEAADAIGVAAEAGCDLVQFGISGRAALELRTNLPLRQTVRERFARSIDAGRGLPIDADCLRNLGAID